MTSRRIGKIALGIVVPLLAAGAVGSPSRRRLSQHSERGTPSGLVRLTGRHGIRFRLVL
jgi:hypothetical protein